MVPFLATPFELAGTTVLKAAIQNADSTYDIVDTALQNQISTVLKTTAQNSSIVLDPTYIMSLSKNVSLPFTQAEAYGSILLTEPKTTTSIYPSDNIVTSTVLFTNSSFPFLQNQFNLTEIAFSVQPAANDSTTIFDSLIISFCTVQSDRKCTNPTVVFNNKIVGLTGLAGATDDFNVKVPFFTPYSYYTPAGDLLMTVSLSVNINAGSVTIRSFQPTNNTVTYYSR